MIATRRVLRRLAGTALLCLAPLTAQEAAPPPDLATQLASLPWQREEVGDGVILRRVTTHSLFEAPQALAVLEIGRGDHRRPRLDVVAPDSWSLVPTSSLAEQHGALAAVNGGFFDTQDGTPIGLLVDEGKRRMADHPKMAVAASVDRHGAGHVLARTAAGGWPAHREALAAWPLLVRDGAVLAAADWAAQTVRHPRTAFGTRRDGSYLLLTVDGRSRRAAGLTLLELAELLRAMGCDDAMNLDGGGSTAMWVRGLGIVNHPSDNRRFDAAGERAVANALTVHAAPRQVLDDGDAVCMPAGAWRSLLAPGAHGGALRRGAGKDARAVFTVDLPAGDRPWRLELRRPGRATSWVIELPRPDGATRQVRVGAQATAAEGWLEVGRLPAAGATPRRIDVVVQSAHGPLWIDALRVTGS